MKLQCNALMRRVDASFLVNGAPNQANFRSRTRYPCPQSIYPHRLWAP